MTRGMVLAAGIAISLFLGILILDSLGEGLGEEIVLLVSLVSFATLGSVFVGATVGIVAGAFADRPSTGFAGGFLSAVLGHLVVLLLVFSAVAIIGDGGDASFAAGSTVISWSDFGRSLAFLVPAGISGAFAGGAMAPRDVPH